MARPRPAAPDAAAGIAAQARASAFDVVGRRGDLADARPGGGFAGIAPGRGGGDGGIARPGRRPAAAASRAAAAASRRQHHHVGVAAGAQHFVQVRDLADAALAGACSRPAARVRVSQRSMMARPRGPAWASSASQTRVPGRRAGIQRGQAGVERVVVGADRHQRRWAARWRAARRSLASCGAVAAAPARGSGGRTRRSGRALPAGCGRWSG